MDNNSLITRVGVYVDGPNIARNGGYGMRFDVLRDLASRDGAKALRLNAYVTLDEERMRSDPEYRPTLEFHSQLRDFGYKVIEKPIRWYVDEKGERFGKANADLDMAVDILLQSEKLDRVLLVTGDGDFVRVVRALQNKGCRVEVLAFKNVSRELRREADSFICGYLVPNLLPFAEEEKQKIEWGEIGSWVRGVCYACHHDRSYGFLRYLKKIVPDLWLQDTRKSDSGLGSVFVHVTAFPKDLDLRQLPSRDLILEFRLGAGEKGPVAEDVRLVARL